MKTIEEIDDNRWSYMGPICERLARLEGSVLELGPATTPIVPGADTMDRRSYGIPLTYEWNATIAPWPIADKQYDIFIALQVFEHLKGKQSRAWGEVCRIANRAIISVPWEWPGDGSHSGIDNKTIRSWTGNACPSWSLLVPEGSRMIFEFLLN